MSLRRPVGLVALLAMAASVIALLPVTTANAQAGDPAVSLNEIHYDNDSTDSGELVEVAGPAGTDLTGWTVVLYNGSNGTVYGTRELSGTLTDQSGGYGFQSLTYPSNGIQNGAPDGVALVDADGALVQFLSYEGAFTGVGGPADGITSTDIGVAEAGSEPAGQSLQLTGTGDSYADFSWTGPAEDTPDAANNGQSFGAGGGEPEPASGRDVMIHEVQGSGPASPLQGERVNVEAVATSLITADDVLDGFYLQEQDTDVDGDAATSEGVYVFCRDSCPEALAAGDLVQVTGVVDEFFDNTQLDARQGPIAVVDSGLPLPTAAVIELPADTSTRDPATFEAVEGMRTTIPTTLAVSEYFNLARFGEVVLTADERPFQFTQTNAPSEEGFSAFQADLATRRIILDDDSNSQNAATTGPADNEPYYYPTPGLSTGNAFRGGDTVSDLTGVFEYSFGAWKLRPVTGADYTFERTNPRPASPEDVGGRLQVASFNVLNYFATIDETSSRSEGPCGPSDTLDCRGADSEAERARQLDKIVAALTEIDADVVGLIEIENDEGRATEQIVEALNAATAPGTYDSIDTGFVGTDAIKQAFLYKPATVTPVGDFATLTSEDDARFVDTRNRPALIQTFEEAGTQERVTVTVNHFKSKGSGCGDGDDSQADGSGNCDGTRTEAAQALADHLATDPTGSGDPDHLIIGDLNSYAMERPITALTDDGYVDLLQRFTGPDAYGYLFDGQLGTLDYGLANSSLNGQVTGAGGWKVNADEPPLLDYNDTVTDAGEASFERKSTALPLYQSDAYRSSDHDPVLVGLDLAGPGSEQGPQPGPQPQGPFQLTLLHNNDGESALLPVAPRGGIARFGTLVQDLRAQADDEGGSLLLSSGDNFLAGPQLQASLENFSDDEDYGNDGPFYDALALDFLDYDASAVGNHEFDFGPQGLGYFISQFEDSNIRFVSSNLDVTGEQALEQFVSPSPGEAGTLVEWTRTEVDGRSVAVVGATTPRLPSISSPGPDVEAREDVQAAVQDAIDDATADDSTDIVVLVAHLQNIAEDQALVPQLSGIDAVIAGGGDELLAGDDDVLLPGASEPFGAYPLLATGADDAEVPIVTTQGSYGYLGRLILDIDGEGDVTAVDDRSGPVRNVFDPENPPEDQRTPNEFLVENVEEPVEAFVDTLRREVVAQTEVPLNTVTRDNRSRETNLGSLFADALRVTAEQGAPEEFGADNPTVALQNSGGIRSDSTYGPGAVSRFDTFQIAPFSNFVGYTTGLAPDKLKELLERSVSADTTDGALQPEGRFGQISGLELVYDPAQAAQTVTRNDDGTVTITGAGERVRQVTLTNNTADPGDDIVVVRNGEVVGDAPEVDLAANSFTVGQNGDNYPFNLAEGQFINLPSTYQQSLESYLRTLGTVTAEEYPGGGLGRITVGGDTEAEPDPGRDGRSPQAEAGGRLVDDSCPDGQVPAQQFPDVPAGDIHGLAVRCMAWYDIAEGFPDGSYRPLAGVTRGQMASFIARTVAEGGGTLPEAPADRFSDDNDSVHRRSIDQLAAVGIVIGREDGTYGPDELVTRAQMSSFLEGAYKHVTGEDLPLGSGYFSDLDGVLQRDDINRIAAVGITGGADEDRYDPAAVTLRGQMATFLARLVDLLVEDGFTTPPQ